MANGFGQTNFADALLFQQPQLGSLQGLFPGITDPSLTGGQPQFNPGLPQGAAPRTDFLGALELPAPGLAQAQVDSVQRLQKAAPQGIQAPPQLQDQAAPLGAPLAREGLLAQLQQNQIGADAAIPQTDSGFGPQGFAPPRSPLPAFNAPEFTPVQGSIGALPPLQGLQGTQSLQGLQGTQQLRPIGQQVPGGQQGGGLVPFSGGAQQKTAAAPQQATRAAQGQPQQPPVTPGQLAGGLGGQIAGGAARDAIGGAIFGGAPAAPTILNAAPAAPNLISANFAGSTAATPGFAATALPAAGVVGGVATGAAQLAGAQELLSGEKPSAIESAALFPFTGGFDVLAGLGGAFGSSRASKERKRRDGFANFLDSRLNNKPFQTTSGAEFDFSEGSRFLTPTERAVGQGDQKIFDVNFDDARAAEAVSLVQPLGRLMAFEAGGTSNFGKSSDDLTGMFTNAVLSSGDPLENAKELYSQLGVTDATKAEALLNNLYQAVDISDEDKAIFMNSVNRVFG